MRVSSKDATAHEATCKLYKKEIEDMAKKLVKPVPKGYVNRSTFECPFCKKANMAQKEIVSHITKHHRFQPGV